MDLRRYAREQPCLVRLPGICNFDSSTVVLAHFRLTGISGMGLKPPDIIAAWACSACHAEVDRSKDVGVQLAFAHAVFRTQYALINQNILLVREKR